MASNHAKIWKAIKSHLEAYPNIPMVAYGGQSFELPVSSEPYLIVDDVRFDAVRRYHNTNGPTWQTGNLVVGVMVPIGVDEGGTPLYNDLHMAEYAGAIAEYFAQDTAMTFDGVTIKVSRAPTISGAGYRDDGYFRIPVIVPWEGWVGGDVVSPPVEPPVEPPVDPVDPEYAVWDETFNTSDFTYSQTNVANDTVTRLDTGGARYPRSNTAVSSGKVYFEIQTTDGMIFAGIGVDGASQNGGTNGVHKSGILFTNIQHTGGTVSSGTTMGLDQHVSIAVDVDNALLWIKTELMTDWNADVSADPASGTGGLDISGMDTSALVPMCGAGSGQVGAYGVLIADPDDWLNAAPSGFNAIEITV